MSNNVVENNGGSYGTIRIGTPDIPAPNSNQHNPGARIVNNRIVQNAGTNLAGAVGLFAGADGYEVSGNDVCGNFSLEYGAGVSVYGRSPNGTIHHNRITLNNSNDEGGGIMIAGALPADPDDLSEGSGPVDIYANQIQGNLANDDGGGIRFLQAGNFPMKVVQQRHRRTTSRPTRVAASGSTTRRTCGSSTTRSWTTSPRPPPSRPTGCPLRQGCPPPRTASSCRPRWAAVRPSFSNPLLFNNVLWNNRAGTRAGTTVIGIGLPATRPRSTTGTSGWPTAPACWPR